MGNYTSANEGEWKAVIKGYSYNAEILRRLAVGIAQVIWLDCQTSEAALVLHCSQRPQIHM